jgi:Domain of unknown function (DUF4397)
MNNFTKALALLTVGLGFAACAPTASSTQSQMGAAQTGTAMVRVAHLSPNTPNVDIWLDGKVVEALKNVPFKAVSGYLSIPAGKHDVAVYAAGTTSNPPIDVKGLTLEAKAYTVAAVGLLGSSGAQALKPAVFVDDLSAKAGKARVRVIHASPDAPAVDVAVQGGAVVVPNLSYPNATGYLELDAGAYPLEIRAAGMAAAVFKFSTPALAANKIYTVFAVGRLGTAAEFGVLAVTDGQ